MGRLRSLLRNYNQIYLCDFELIQPLFIDINCSLQTVWLNFTHIFINLNYLFSSKLFVQLKSVSFQPKNINFPIFFRKVVCHFFRQPSSRLHYLNISVLLLAVASVEGSLFNITKVNRLHMGAYLCIASNGVPPTVSKRIMLIVHCESTFAHSIVYYLSHHRRRSQYN